MSLWRSAVSVLVALVLATVIGGVLASIADMALGGPGAAPGGSGVWTLVGMALVVGVWKYRNEA